MIHVTPLGIGSALPSKTFHFSATVVEFENRFFLFDCGEGTQVRLLEAGLSPSRLQGIFITHLHGDHYFGLPGLLSTLSLINHSRDLTIVGPPGLQSFLNTILAHTPNRTPSFQTHFIELTPDFQLATVFETDTCKIEARPIEHNTFTIGYRFEEKDRPGNLDVNRARELGIEDYRDYRLLKEGHSVKTESGRVVQSPEVVSPSQPGSVFAYVTDSRPCETGQLLARNADLLYHEATFLERDHSRALQTKHATAREAAALAHASGAKHLLIGHFSARYPQAELFVEEAREVFQNTEAAEELKRYTVCRED